MTNAQKKIMLALEARLFLRWTHPEVGIDDSANAFCNHPSAVFGGRQGAQSINRAVTEGLEFRTDLKTQLRFVHQTGERQIEEVRRAYEAKGFTADVRAFFNAFHEQYAAADLIISRAGAT